MQIYPLTLYRDGFETSFGELATDTIIAVNEQEHLFALTEGWKPGVEYLQHKIARAAARPMPKARPRIIVRGTIIAPERHAGRLPTMPPPSAVAATPHRQMATSRG